MVYFVFNTSYILIMSLPNSSNISIQDLIKALENGEYRVPRFQRDYVWDVKKAANLVDSILRGYPIGSVILWRW